MEWGDVTVDRLDEIIVRAEEDVARSRAMEMAAIAEKKARKTHIHDGQRSIVDWRAVRADVSYRTARRLCWTATRIAEAPDVAVSLSEGDIIFDRAEQVSRLPGGRRSGHERYDISQLKKLVAPTVGSATDAKDLVSVCRFHHHVAIHRLGLEILRLGASRIRVKRPRRGRSPPPRMSHQISRS